MGFYLSSQYILLIVGFEFEMLRFAFFCEYAMLLLLIHHVYAYENALMYV